MLSELSGLWSAQFRTVSTNLDKHARKSLKRNFDEASAQSLLSGLNNVVLCRSLNPIYSIQTDANPINPLLIPSRPR